MISSVHGTVLEVSLDHVVIAVGGVGLAVQATPATLSIVRRGEEVSLYTALVVREDSLTLFGFADQQARELFGLLQTVSGIGPRLALATLAVLEPDKLTSAIAEGNISLLTQVPGIGRKGAERLSLELRDKVSAPTAVSDAADPAVASNTMRSSVIDALTGLGFPVKQAEHTVDQVLSTSSDSTTNTATILRAALTALGGKR